MKLKFKNKDFQTDAVNAVVDKRANQKQHSGFPCVYKRRT